MQVVGASYLNFLFNMTMPRPCTSINRSFAIVQVTFNQGVEI